MDMKSVIAISVVITVVLVARWLYYIKFVSSFLETYVTDKFERRVFFVFIEHTDVQVLLFFIFRVTCCI